MRPEDLLARLEAGYEYDPMYGQLCNERDQLKAENAKLRELGEQYETVLADYRSEVVKLRELAARAWRLFTENGAVHPSDLPEVDAVRDGLRELGVEVDE